MQSYGLLASFDVVPIKRGAGMRSPDAVKHQCTLCGATTKVNIRTGCLYSHPIPGEVRVCAMSGTRVIEGIRGKPFLLPPLRQQPNIVARRRTPDPDEPSVSVHAVPSGLPGLGKRR